jgi:hypothetical protein
MDISRMSAGAAEIQTGGSLSVGTFMTLPPLINNSQQLPNHSTNTQSDRQRQREGEKERRKEN